MANGQKAELIKLTETHYGGGSVVGFGGMIGRDDDVFTVENELDVNPDAIATLKPNDMGGPAKSVITTLSGKELKVKETTDAINRQGIGLVKLTITYNSGSFRNSPSEVIERELDINPNVIETLQAEGGTGPAKSAVTTLLGKEFKVKETTEQVRQKIAALKP